MDEPAEIHYGIRGPEFANYIRNLLKMGGVKPEYIDVLLDDTCMEMYNIALTTKLASPDRNLETLEFIGDVTVNKIVVWYLSRRFPQLMDLTGNNVGTLNRLKTNLVSKVSLAKVGSLMHMERFITCTEEQWNIARTKIMEDSFEALIGAIEQQIDIRIRIGIGYAICYNIVAPLYDQIELSLDREDLYDSVSRLKEVFDQLKKTLGAVEYKSRQLDDNTFVTDVVSVLDGRQSRIGEGRGKSKKASQLAAAEHALAYLLKRGFARLPKGEDFAARLPPDARVRVSSHDGYVRATVSAGGKDVSGIGYSDDEARQRAAYIFLSA